MGTMANYEGVILPPEDWGEWMDAWKDEGYSSPCQRELYAYSLQPAAHEVIIGTTCPEKLGLVQLPFGHLECRHTVPCSFQPLSP